MHTTIIKILLGFWVLVLMGCSYTRPDMVIPIHPEIPTSATKTGQSQVVTVHVIDQRKSNVIGNTSGMEAMTGNPVWIRTASDLPNVLTLKLNDQLLLHGFTTTSSPQTRELTANLIKLNYLRREAGMNSIHEFKAVIEISAKNGNKYFRRIYNSDMSYKTPWLLKQAQYDEYVNNVLSIILKNISHDGELWQFLN